MTKNPLLLLHGALANRQQFDAIIPGLQEHFQVLTMDFSGHGNAAFNEGFTMQRFASEVISFMDEVGLEKTDIFGYSMGGYVGLYLCYHHPERVGKLYTLGTKICWNKEAAKAETGRLDADKMLEKVPAFVEEIKSRHKHMDWRDMLHHTKEMMLDLGQNPSLSKEMLNEIKHSVCIAVGDKDITVPVAEAVEVFGLMPGASLQVFPATPHPLERAPLSLLLPSLLRFLEGKK